MANLKNITELPVAESAEGLNLIVEQDGAAKRVAADVVCKVKSVNGAMPDENGNVQIDIPEGFSGSWNDLTDKPFGEGEEIVILERATHDGFFNPEAEFNVLEGLPELDIVIGDTVKVFWDGEVYSCLVQGYNNSIYFGNGVYIQQTDNGQPFCFSWHQDHGTDVVAYGDLSVTSHTFGVTKVNVKKIDEKYIPGYDLVITYHGDIIGEYNPLELEPISASTLKNVCQKLKNRQQAKVLFRNIHNLYGWNPHAYTECPMTVIWDNQGETATVYALVVTNDGEGILMRIVRAGFNENEFFGIGVEGV